MIYQQGQSDHYYDGYDYATFWNGREYEDAADKIAVKHFLEKTPDFRKRIVDIGSGGGRMTPLYVSMFEESTLVDPSRSQLEIAEAKYKDLPHLRFLQGTAEKIPLPAQSVDVVLCVRVFHYVERPQTAFAEVKRILRPGGYFILEIPNKTHAKARLRNLIRGKDRKAYRTKVALNISSNGDDVFLNHNPHAIMKDLAAEGFTIIEKLSVSNLRSFGLKRHVSLRFLISLEQFLQPLLSRSWFGPSIYFLAKLEKQNS